MIQENVAGNENDYDKGFFAITNANSTTYVYLPYIRQRKVKE
jgi:hypothetical protein